MDEVFGRSNFVTNVFGSSGSVHLKRSNLMCTYHNLIEQALVYKSDHRMQKPFTVPYIQRGGSSKVQFQHY